LAASATHCTQRNSNNEPQKPATMNAKITEILKLILAERQLAAAGAG
jgi:hypothetical protein